MKTRLVLVALLIAGIGMGPANAQFTNFQFTPIDDPLSTNGTFPSGISGNKIVGTYQANGFEHGFIYDGTTFTTFDDPAGAGNPTNGLTGISGDTLVGAYVAATGAAGYIYQNGVFTDVIFPGGSTKVTAISGNLVIGTYIDSIPHVASRHAFTYDGTTYSEFTVPGGVSAELNGISNGKMVGSFVDEVPSSDTTIEIGKGFLYDGTNYTKLEDPQAATAIAGTVAYGISGDTIVGNYIDINNLSHGFIFAHSTYTTLDHPLAVNGTVLTSIDGLDIVGFYIDAQGKDHGFLATPAPVLFNSWLTNHGVSTSLPSSAILYNDGVPLAVKYLTGIDPSRPMTPADRLALPIVVRPLSATTPGVSLRYRRVSSASQVQAQLQTSADMLTWTDDTTDVPVTTGNDMTTGDPIVEVHVSLDTGKKFVRLKVTGP